MLLCSQCLRALTVEAFVTECKHLQQYASTAEGYMQEAVSPFSAAVCVYVKNVFFM